MHTSDVTCARCGQKHSNGQRGHQLGSMIARWGQGSQHAGEQYEIPLCESCFLPDAAHRGGFFALTFPV